jgi:hypothetical protein
LPYDFRNPVARIAGGVPAAVIGPAPAEART